MTTEVQVRRPVTNMAAIVLCCLAGILPTASNGPADAPGIAMAAEAAEKETPSKEPEPGDSAKDVPAQSVPSKNGEDGPSGNEPAKSDADESEEIFVPSEDISEDIDVPFPVDI